MTRMLPAFLGFLGILGILLVSPTSSLGAGSGYEKQTYDTFHLKSKSRAPVTLRRDNQLPAIGQANKVVPIKDDAELKILMSCGTALFENGYYDIPAVCSDGAMGGSLEQSATHKVHIIADSYWMIRNHDSGPHVDPDGNGDSGANPSKLVAPNLRAFALIGRWIVLDLNNGDIGAYGGWFLVGSDKTEDVPQLGLGFGQHLHIMYICNDETDGFFDNAGWIHVHEHI